MTATWLLIVWAIALDGNPTFPITITPMPNFATCAKAAVEARHTPKTGAVCRPTPLH